MSITTQFEATDGSLTLTNAILLYQGGERDDLNRFVLSRKHGPTFASIHDVELLADGMPTIAAGTPLTREHLRQWTEALGRNQVPEILPDNVLVAHPDVLAWWVPAKVRTSYFALSHPPKTLQALAKRIVLQLPYPAHVFVATRGRLGVYALRSSERPTADTALLHSPILNVFISGQLCWGNVPVPKSINPAAIPEYERAVFDSWSTHPNPGQEHTVPGRGGLVRLWDKLAARRATTFPAELLKPFPSDAGAATSQEALTLGALIKRSARA